MSHTSAIAGIDLGGTRIKAMLRNAETGEEMDRKILPTNDGDEPADTPVWAEAIHQLIQDWESEHQTPIEAVGIACPGLAHRDGSHIVHMPGRLQGLEGFDFNSFLSRETYVINDAQAALLGELLEGAAQGYKDLLMLTLGTGVGGAILMDGRLLRGHLGRAGHCGHLCMDPNGEPGITGLPGTLEDAIGNHNIAKRSGGKFTSTKDLTDAVQAGDKEAKAIWDKSVHHLGCGIASLVNIVDPEAVLIGGGIAQVGDLLFDSLKDVLDDVEWRPGTEGVKILRASLGEWAGAIGALPMEPKNT